MMSIRMLTATTKIHPRLLLGIILVYAFVSVARHEYLYSTHHGVRSSSNSKHRAAQSSEKGVQQPVAVIKEITNETNTTALRSNHVVMKMSTACKQKHHIVYDHLKVAELPVSSSSKGSTYFLSSSSSSLPPPRILCFIMTHAGAHTTKIKTIQSTWGSRCDNLIVASNVTDPSINAVAMKSPSHYLGLWTKLNETLQYLYDNYRDGGYDWIYKADDDTYAILENLKAYLSSPEVLENAKADQPVIYGRIYSSPRYRDLITNKDFYFKDPQNKAFGERFFQRINRNDPVLYNYGGPGYVMNWNYVERFLEINKGPDTLHGTPPEDQVT
jgi:Fringe-like